MRAFVRRYLKFWINILLIILSRLSLMRIYITDSQFLKQVSRCKSMSSAEFASLENYGFKSWGTLREFGEEGGSFSNKYFPKDLFTSHWRSSTKWFPLQVVHRPKRFWLQKPNSPVVLHLRAAWQGLVSTTLLHLLFEPSKRDELPPWSTTRVCSQYPRTT